MRQFFSLIFVLLLTFIPIVTFAVNGNSILFDDIGLNSNLSDNTLSAAISGSTSVCQNTAKPVVTFTGSGGKAPYIFTYKINDGAEIKTPKSRTATIKVPTDKAGIYTYTLLSVTDNTNSTISKIETATITVNSPPVVDFIYSDNQCSGTNVQFTSSVTGAAPFSYVWDFGDSNSSTSSNPTFIFSSLGCGTATFPIKLTVTDANGLSSTIIHNLVIKQKPDIDIKDLDNPFDPFSNCNNASVSPIYKINVGNNSNSNCISSFLIVWGDGNTDSNVTFPTSHTYSQIGIYNMYVTAFGTNGCSNSINYVVNNEPYPSGKLISAASTINLCDPNTKIDFTISDWATNSLGTTYRINYGDNSPDSILNLTQIDLKNSIYYNSSNPSASANYPVPHTYKTTSCPKNYYSASLAVTNACGSRNGSVDNIIILSKPEANFTVSPSACVNTSVLFTNITVAAYGLNCSLKAVYTWDFGDGSPIVTTSLILPNHTYTAKGNYTITLTSENYCGKTTKTQQICVEPPVTPQFSLSSNEGCAPFSINTTNSTDITDVCITPTYLWEVTYTASNCGTTPNYRFTNGTSTSSANPSFEFINPGTYTVKLSVTTSCGTETTSKTVTVKQPPTVVINNIDDYCGTASIHPTAEVNICSENPTTLIYAWSFPGGTPTTANTLDPGTINYSTYGDYTVSLKVTNECGFTIANKTFAVKILPLITDGNLALHSSTICSDSIFKVTPTSINGDTVPVGTTYTWSLPIINPVNAITGGSAQTTAQTLISQVLTNTTRNLATATYTVTPILGLCNGNDFTVQVQVIPTIHANATVNNITCFGANDGSIITNIDGGIPFSSGNPFTTLWTGPNGFTANTKDISGLSPGDYTVTITDAGGCPVTANYTIIQPTEIVISMDVKTDINCYNNQNGLIGISVSGGVPPYSYNWTKDGLPFATTEDIIDLDQGVYEVTVTDDTGCDSKVQKFTVTEPQPLVINLVKQTNVFCKGDSTGAITIDVVGGTIIEKSPGVFDYTYLWSGPNGFASSDKNLTKLAIGTYHLTVTDKNNCTQNFSNTITEPTELILSTTKTPVTCYGANDATITAIVSGGTTPYTLQWSNFGSGSVQNNLQPGNYTVKAIDGNGCEKSVSVNIPESNFTFHPVVKHVSCNGGHDGYINLNISGGITPISVIWDDDPSAGGVRNNLNPGTYNLILHDAAPCNIIESFVIREPQPIVITANIKNAFDCNNLSSGAIDISVTGGKPPYTYSWSNNAITEDLINIPAGKYFIMVTDSNICSKSAQFEVIRQKPMELSVTSKTDYDCNTKGFLSKYTAHVSGGFSPFKFTWSNGKVSGVNNEFMETNQNNTVVLQATDSLGCSATYDFTVDNTILNQTFGIDYMLVDCSKFIYQFNAIDADISGENYTYNWDFGDGKASTLKNVQHIYSTPGNYKIQLTISNGFCTTYFEKMVLVESLPKLSLDREPKICEGDSAVFHVTGALTYKWSDGNESDSIVLKEKGDYNVIGTSRAGCKDTLRFTASYFSPLTYSILSDKDEVASDSPLHLWSENIPYSHYLWDFGDGNVGEGVDLYHSFGVSEDKYFDVKLKVLNPNGCVEYATKRIWITIPNLPNIFIPNGGVNDLFLKGWQIKLYNRNGIVIYEGKDGWNGTYKDKVVTSGTYFYVLSYPSASGTKLQNGYVTVVR